MASTVAKTARMKLLAGKIKFSLVVGLSSNSTKVTVKMRNEDKDKTMDGSPKLKSNHTDEDDLYSGFG